MYLCHYFEGNKNDSPGSEHIGAPLRLLKYSLITVFYPKVIMECVPKWITFLLSLSLSLHLFCFPPLSCHSCPLYYFQSPSSLFNGLHMSAKWPWHCCDKVKCPSALSHAVRPRVRSQCSAYSTQSPSYCQPTCPNHTIRIPIHQSPVSQPFVTAACYRREKNGHVGFLLHISFTLRGQILFIRLTSK